MRNEVSSATYRTDVGNDGNLVLRFLFAEDRPGSIHPGTAIYDVNGHVALVYDIDEDGRIYYMDAHPDHTLSRSVYGPQFGQSPSRLGGGLKNWRPLKLGGARRQQRRQLDRAAISCWPATMQLSDFSLEQYRGNVPGVAADGAARNVPIRQCRARLFRICPRFGVGRQDDL